jgi:hypothetical protein
MSTVDDIQEAIQQGVTPQKLAEQVDWKTLSTDERDDLLDTARSLNEDPQGYELLKLLFLISQDNEYTTRVLGYIAQHTALDATTRQKTLRSMRRMLDKLRPQMSSADSESAEEAPMYRLYDAAYQVLNGQVLSELGSHQEALRSIQQAVDIYTTLGFTQPLARLEKELRRLRTLLSQPQSLYGEQPAARRGQTNQGDAPNQPHPSVQPASQASHPAVHTAYTLPPKVESEDEGMAVLAELQTEIEKQQLRREQLRREVNNLEQRLKSSPAQPAEFIGERSSQGQQRIEALQNQLKEERERNQQLQQQLRQHPAQAQIASQQRDVLRREMAEIKEQINAGREENESLQQQIEQKQNRLDEVSVQRETLHNEITELRRQAKELLHEIDKLKAEKQDLELE